MTSASSTMMMTQRYPRPVRQWSDVLASSKQWDARHVTPQLPLRLLEFLHQTNQA